ncbi:MAG: LmeA family phospholipid-binding protein [Nitriliruptorales bacterium]|nr:LmeA family phospholipid-binding protein [Nitriliruptorales bacterium]
MTVDVHAGRRPRTRLSVAAAVLAGLVVVAELVAAPLVGSRAEAALAACGIDDVRVDLGARPHLWSLVTGEVNDVHVEMDGLHVGPLRVDRIDVELARVAFGRRQVVGIPARVEIEGGHATAVVTEADLDELVALPFSRVDVSDRGVRVVLLGASIDVFITAAHDRVELRLVDESVPAIQVGLPAGVEVIGVTPSAGTLAVEAEITGAVDGNGIGC